MKSLTPDIQSVLPRIRDRVENLERMPRVGDGPFADYKKALAAIMHSISLDVGRIGNYDGHPDSVIALAILQRWTLSAMFPRDLQIPMDLFVNHIHDLLDHFDEDRAGAA